MQTTYTAAMSRSRLGEIRCVLWTVLALNLFVALAKLMYGLLSASLSMQADGLHSLFDAVSNVIGLLGLWMASAPVDADHPYGHKKFEALATTGIGGMLLVTCVYLLWKTVQTWGGSVEPTVTPVSFGVMVVTMAINFCVMKWERRKGRELGSDILLADSYHTRSDFLTSFSVLVGLMAIRLGYSVIDPIVALIIAGFIAWTAYSVLREVIASLTDHVRLNPEMVRAVVLEIPGILDCHAIRTRGLPSHIFVDLSIHVQPHISIEKAHALAHRVSRLIKTRCKGVEDVIVHTEPDRHR